MNAQAQLIIRNVAGWCAAFALFWVWRDVLPALTVFDKVTLAAELTLHRVLPALVNGTAPYIVQNLSQGSYFSGRKPEDGYIDWNWPATRIHDLVRAVAPPYPGAFTTVAGQSAQILRTRVELNPPPYPNPPLQGGRESVLAEIGGRLIAHCASGEALRVLELDIAGQSVFPAQLADRLGPGPWRLGDDKACFQPA